VTYFRLLSTPEATLRTTAYYVGTRRRCLWVLFVWFDILSICPSVPLRVSAADAASDVISQERTSSYWFLRPSYSRDKWRTRASWCMLCTLVAHSGECWVVDAQVRDQSGSVANERWLQSGGRKTERVVAGACSFDGALLTHGISFLSRLRAPIFTSSVSASPNRR